MKIGVLIQKYYLDSEIDSKGILRALSDLSIPYNIVDWNPHGMEYIFWEGEDVDFLTSIGSISFVRDLHRRMKKHKPMHNLFDPLLHRFSLYQHMIPKEFSLNSDGFMLPFSEIRRRNFEQISGLLSANSVFIKPDNGLKICEASVINRDNLSDWKSDIEKYSGAGENSLFWIFPAVQIDCEYRCLVVNSTCISISTYSHDGNIACVNINDENLINFVNDASKHIRIEDPCYIMDVALIKGQFKVIELNCLATSGQYMLNKTALYSTLIEQVQVIYNDLYLP